MDSTLSKSPFMRIPSLWVLETYTGAWSKVGSPRLPSLCFFIGWECLLILFTPFLDFPCKRILPGIDSVSKSLGLCKCLWGLALTNILIRGQGNSTCNLPTISVEKENSRLDPRRIDWFYIWTQSYLHHMSGVQRGVSLCRTDFGIESWSLGSKCYFCMLYGLPGICS